MRGGNSEEDIVTINTYAIRIFKFDQNDQSGLEGAVFELYQKDEEGNTDQESIIELVSGKDGYITTNGLKEGTYYLKETTAPSGYVCSETELEVVVPNGADTENIINVRFANSLIPHTGGTGTRMYTIAGAAIVIGAGALLVVSRRKKED